MLDPVCLHLYSRSIPALDDYFFFFLAGVLISTRLGRIYCGLVCPINTAMIFIAYLKKKTKLKSLRIPSLLTHPLIRSLILLLFIATFFVSMRFELQIPVLPLLFALGIILALFFPPQLWHRFLCPYGTILKLSSQQTKSSIKIDYQHCNNCSLCQKVCPAEAVSYHHQKYAIIKNDCLICFKCSDKCPKNAIAYQKL